VRLLKEASLRRLTAPEGLFLKISDKQVKLPTTAVIGNNRVCLNF